MEALCIYLPVKRKPDQFAAVPDYCCVDFSEPWNRQENSRTASWKAAALTKQARRPDIEDVERIGSEACTQVNRPELEFGAFLRPSFLSSLGHSSCDPVAEFHSMLGLMPSPRGISDWRLILAGSDHTKSALRRARQTWKVRSFPMASESSNCSNSPPILSPMDQSAVALTQPIWGSSTSIGA